MEDLVVLGLRNAAVFHMHPNLSKHMVLKLTNKTVVFKIFLIHTLLHYWHIEKKIAENLNSQLKK